MTDDSNPGGRVLLDAADLTMVRVNRFTKFRIRPAVYSDIQPTRLRAWTVDGEPVPFATAVLQNFEPFDVGQKWGRPWDTVWFEVEGAVPHGWGPEETELVVDLGFVDEQPGFQAEGTVYRPDGSIIKAIEPLNAWVPLPPNGTFRLFIEAAANPVVQVPYEYEPTRLGDLATSGSDPFYRLGRIDVARRDLTVWELVQDIDTLTGLVGVLPQASVRRAEIVEALDRMVDGMDPDNIAGTAARGREILAAALASPAVPSTLTISAVGHAHIDCAWLWPTRETVRKVARTFSNVLDLIERDADFIFAASSAQQYAWLKDSQPALFERVREAVKSGRIRPVGGMWVESDTNMPGGESLVRQFVMGKSFFFEEFGVDSDEVWLPDSFGYTAALPQIMRAAGARYFLTQKPSWNETNHMPYSTFQWEGIDGSQVFTHFPPAETYNSDLGAADLARSERVFSEKGRAREVMGLFGFGDGEEARPAKCWPPPIARPTSKDPLAYGSRIRTRSSRGPKLSWLSHRSGLVRCTSNYIEAPSPRNTGPSRATAGARLCFGRPNCGPPPRPCFAESPTPMTSCRALGEWSSCSSSMTSCPARRLRGSTRRPNATTIVWRATWRCSSSPPCPPWPTAE